MKISEIYNIKTKSNEIENQYYFCNIINDKYCYYNVQINK